jgi:hypothetical protein
MDRPLPHIVTPEEAKAVIDSGLAAVELKLVTSFCAPLYWVVRNPDGTVVARNGTAFFLDAGNGPFGVTACHVIEGWKRSPVEQEASHLRLAGEGTSVLLDWDARAIDANPEIDIATFSVMEAEVRSLGKTILTGAQRRWPPLPPPENCALYYCGFPAVGTVQLSPDAVSFGALPGAGIATSVGEKNISILIERSYLVPILGGGIPPENFNFGGISGGLVLKVIETLVRTYAPAGVIYEGPNPSQDPDQAIAGFELIRVRHAHFILPDGRLDLGRWRDVNP